MFYGFGDFLGVDFDSFRDNSKFVLEILVGTWNEQGAENLSKFREFGNFVIKI